ncbi:ATP-binding protein [Aspergillus mulundensis]|uniref:Phosphoribosyltransferase domain-containing protein n=1 Tax=Aspergillus mulundensis TaxID=1810919 RepID=A0A3D8T3J0_9EURO|nr:hypothetical protein DSM5745_00422 [Aspergillus mulundensis]RDW93100.1 hypothetical protein DSM5745_00422 [Aspergillus mulundensis]
MNPTSAPWNIAPQATPLPPRLIGLYGIPGSGKTLAIDRLRRQLGLTEFEYFKGSDLIHLATSGEVAFHKLDEPLKKHYRQRAMMVAEATCVRSGKVGVITREFMYWSVGESEEPAKVYAGDDLNMFAHVVYLNTPPEVIAKRRDDGTSRSIVPIEHLRRWQDTEVEELRGLCQQRHIPFTSVYPDFNEIVVPIIQRYNGGLKMYHATDSAATKLLLTPVLDAAVGELGREDAYGKIGAYLATTLLAEPLGIQELIAQYPEHPSKVSGYRLLGEEQTLIVAWRHSGKGIAEGVHGVFPKAKFLPVQQPEDIQSRHIQDKVNAVIVDSLINWKNGEAMAELVRSIRAVHTTIRIVFVAAEVNREVVSVRGPVGAVSRSGEVSVVALRMTKPK